MVKSKRDLKSPRRRNSLSLTNRPMTRIKSGATSISTSTDSVSAANIKVVVRVRPPNEKEQDDNSRIVIKQVDEQMLVFDPKENAQPFFYHGVQQKGRDLLKRANKDLQFIFDKVFGFDSTNHDIFINTTQSLISSLMNGYNCSVFAYGATGAGKTHTMIGNNENPGITMLTMAELFKHKADLMSERDFELGITYLEVYNENVQDLLNPGTPLHLREDGKYGVMVAGNKIHKIDNPDELFSLLEQGNKNRTQHPTDANAESSRSHAVFQVYIQMNIRATSEMRTAKLSMIDLAGSERGAATGYSGARFTEGANINKSLLALGNCINSLADGQRHVPYRDSKLTRLLKDSLGGNCQTVMIANVSPSSFSYEDTYNTLKYATRAKKIKSNMKKNVVKVELHVGQYVKMVEELNKQVAQLKRELEEKSTQAVVKPVDMSQSSQLVKLYAERKEALARIYQIEVSEQLCIMTRQSKEEANSRLSGLIIDSPELCQGHKKLGNSMQRCQKKETAYKEELASMEIKKIELASKTTDLVKKFPQLKQISETEECKLAKFESELKVDLAKKERDFFKQQVEERGDLLSKMCQVLKPCYQQLRGHGLVSEKLTESFQALISDMQGVRGIKWEKEVTDSGMSSTRSNSSSDEEGRPIKRKLDEESAPSSTSLDSTFTMPSCKTKPKICASQLLAKVYKPPPPKRLAKLPSMSPRTKENRLLRKPLGNVDCGNGRLVSRDIKDLKGRKIESQPRRPPFRR